RRWGRTARRTASATRRKQRKRRNRQAGPLQLAPPLPSGERHRRPSAAVLEAKNADAKHRLSREAIRVRGRGPIENPAPPHPNPLPTGERERAEFSATSMRCQATQYRASNVVIFVMSG